MNLEFNNTHSLNMGEDMEFVSIFVKGKKKNYKWHEYRPLFIGLKTGKEYLLIMTVHENDPRRAMFMGAELHFIDNSHFITINNTQLKLKNYNYYFLNNDFNIVNTMLEEWKKTNPLIKIKDEKIAPYAKMNNISGYTYAYKFNNKSIHVTIVFN